MIAVVVETIGHIRVGNEFDIRLIDHNDDVGWNGRNERVEFFLRCSDAGRVVRLADEHQPSALGYGGGHRYQIM